MSGLLTVDKLCVRLRNMDTPIVKDVSFTLQRGSVLAVVGESGSGKTMTCKAVMRLLGQKTFDVSGSIRYRDSELLTKSEKEVRALCGSKIAMIVQNPMTAFDPAAKVGAQIMETLRAHRKISRKEAYEAAICGLEKMHLPRCGQLMNSYPHTLSGGMLQRIVIALSWFLEPDLIIADEATTALDVKNQKMVLDELEKMKRKGMGVLLVTHDFGVVARLADNVIVMKEGEIIERGAVYDIFDAPGEEYTKELLQACILSREGCHA